MRFIFALLATASVVPDNNITSNLRIIIENFSKMEADKFASEITPPIVDGEHFIIKFPFLSGDRSGVDSGGSTIWTYDNGKLKLWFNGNDPIFYKVERIKNGSYIGESNFGVRRNVFSYTAKEFGILALSRPKGEFSPFTTEDDIKWTRNHDGEQALDLMKNTYIVQMDVSGPEAKRLTVDTYAEVEGTIKKAKNGKFSNCKSQYSGPQVDNPWALTTQSCYIYVSISRVTFKDKRGNVVLKEWKTVPAEQP
ncbi:hypothetical protein HHL08_24580 [Sphingobium sp. AR-3-1]|uniref:Uncharacterized protein n=1 Tax=Sphingobium psychrophilum TaxID=2728834 RepID=A0A7X9ZWC3_9SPHN|nr:hypothetical protein [Sphingobium psychrophilum]NML13254.1 hypothetical protein [Sphingobium psychrophilum]